MRTDTSLYLDVNSAVMAANALTLLALAKKIVSWLSGSTRDDWFFECKYRMLSLQLMSLMMPYGAQLIATPNKLRL